MENSMNWKSHFPIHHYHWPKPCSTSLLLLQTWVTNVLTTCLCNTTNSSPYILQHWTWRQHVPLKYQDLPTRTNGVTTLKTTNWAVVITKTSKLIQEVQWWVTSVRWPSYQVSQKSVIWLKVIRRNSDMDQNTIKANLPHTINKKAKLEVSQTLT